MGRLAAGKYLTAEELVSPGEIDPAVTGSAARGVATSLGSYAVLEYVQTPGKIFSVPTPLGQSEWRESLRSTAIVLSDRQTGTDDKYARSIWTNEPGQWEGLVLFNDNHVEYKMTDKGHDGLYGSYRACFSPVGTIDELFETQPVPGHWNYPWVGVGRMVSD